ncbi:mast/stem cell growth factor receptor Kit-like [Chiloscyllium plagiosum]|uniref:mast/stem cell growth factor receptor Kit-like n=1 Tax=Chiloscyllium plagiosum TaxID=36176 RepID=UPI001CB8231D|nr:mast/stem cell growth factor receptor Kit-like [Chiloscyllium plagiosum]
MKNQFSDFHNGGNILISSIPITELTMYLYLALAVLPVACMAVLQLQLDTREQVRLQGESYSVDCIGQAETLHLKVQWIHPQHFPVVVSYSRKYDHLYTKIATLRINAVNGSDSGNFTCVVKEQNETLSAATMLWVVEKGYVQILTDQETVLEADAGDCLQLQVRIEAYPELREHEWIYEIMNNSADHKSTFLAKHNSYESSLFLVRLKESESGTYTFFASNGEANSSLTFHLLINQKPTVTIKKEQITADDKKDAAFRCLASGFPAPSIHWYQCPAHRDRCTENGTINFEKLIPQKKTSIVSETLYGRTEVESVLSVHKVKPGSLLECYASNKAGGSSFSISFLGDPATNALFTPFLSGAVSVAVLLLIFLLLLLYKYKQRPTYEVRWKIIEAVHGNDYTFIDPTQLPYNEKWEFPREKLRLGKILGAGAFGKVVEATAYGLGTEDSATKVAVKMLKPSAHSTEREALMSELKILSHLGQHTHVVNLLGACTLGGPVLVITEYCCYGDLLNFLKNKAQYLTWNDALNDYKNFMHSKKPLSDCTEGYLPMRPRLSSMSPMISQTDSLPIEEDDDPLPLNIEDLQTFSYQVATGMDFLSSRNCIHRDLAARNVLLTKGRIAKICDFGLARDIMNDSNYVVKGNARLPVKWMAPESIFDCVYTVQSDVWSYGILLWEIFSLGSSPYPGIPVDSRFYKLIRSGFQMDRPSSATPELYDIMTKCWNLEPTDRPTFDQIVKLINKQRSVFTEQDYTNLPVEYKPPESPTFQSPDQRNCEMVDETVLLINPYSKI